MDNKGQFGRSMWGAGGQPMRKYGMPARPVRPETKRPEAQNKPADSDIFGTKRFLDKSSLKGKLERRQDFYTDSSIRMGREQRKKFAEKINKLVPGKTTLNPEDIKRVDKKLAREESLAGNTSQKFTIKRERAALKKLFGAKQ